MFALEILQQRRERLMKSMGDNAVGIWVSSPERIRSQSSLYRYRPSSDLLYLTGFQEPDVVLVLRPSDAEKKRVTMFVRSRDKEREIWDGRRLGPERAKDSLGVDQVFSIDDLEQKLPGLLEGADRLFYQTGVDDIWDARILKHLKQVSKQRRMGKITPVSVVESGSLLFEMRLFKSDEELAWMRQAAAITADAHRRAMKVTKPGLFEYQLEALIQYHFRVHGCTEVAYLSIVGGGANAAVLHYVENRDPLKAGELVLIDAGAEYQYYAADITRTFPVNGTFSSRQRDVYQVVLAAEEAALRVCKPGNRFDDIHNTAVQMLTEGLVSLGILKGDTSALVEEGAYKPYYMHKTGHWLGLDVHDVGHYFEEDGSSRILKPGMVLTVEPGLYFHPEFCRDDVVQPFAGMGIRVEDNVLITETGCEVLTAAAPKTVEEIESVVGSASLP